MEVSFENLRTNGWSRTIEGAFGLLDVGDIVSVWALAFGAVKGEASLRGRTQNPGGHAPAP